MRSDGDAEVEGVKQESEKSKRSERKIGEASLFFVFFFSSSSVPFAPPRVSNKRLVRSCSLTGRFENAKCSTRDQASVSATQSRGDETWK